MLLDSARAMTLVNLYANVFTECAIKIYLPGGVHISRKQVRIKLTHSSVVVYVAAYVQWMCRHLRNCEIHSYFLRI